MEVAMNDHWEELMRDLHAEIDFLAKSIEETERRYVRLDRLVHDMHWRAFGLAVMAVQTCDRVALAEAWAMNEAAERVAQVLRP